MQAGREGFDRAYPAAACFGKPVIQGNAGGTLFKRLLDTGTTPQVGEAARQAHDTRGLGILSNPGECRLFVGFNVAGGQTSTQAKCLDHGTARPESGPRVGWTSSHFCGVVLAVSERRSCSQR